MKKHQVDDSVAVCTRDLVACKETQTILPETIIAADAQAAIQAADSVYLAYPPAPLKAVALNAAAAGESIFLEKSLGVDVTDSENLVRKVSSFRISTVVNFTQPAVAAPG